MKSLIAVIVALLLSTSALVAQEEYNWCYRLDLTVANRMTIYEGVWSSGKGIQSNAARQVSAFYKAPNVVTPLLMVMELRYYYIGQPNLQASGTAFGYQFDIVHPVPYAAGTSYTNEFLFYPPAANNGTDFDIFIASPPFSFTSFDFRALTILGDGQNPFGSTNCSMDGVTITYEPPIDLDFDFNDAIDGLSDVNSSLEALPGDLRSAAGGIPNQRGGDLFRYVKWVISPSAMQDLSGPFAPVLQRVGTGLIILFALTSLYALVYVVVLSAKWVVWVFGKIVLILQGIRTLLPF